MTITAKFWAVWRIDGGTPPHKRHATFDAAKAEAERLASTQGGEYYVLETIGAIKRPVMPLEWEDLK